MQLHFLRATSALCGIALLAGSVHAQDASKHLLRLNFQKGSVQKLEMTSVMDMNMDMGGQSMNMAMDMTMFLSSKVKDVQDGVATLEQSITRMKIKMENPMMGTIDFDSADEEADPGPMGDMAAMVGEVVLVKMSDRGEISDVQLPESYLEKLSGMMDEAEVEGIFSRPAVVLPEGPIAVGESWDYKTDMPMGGGMGDLQIAVQNKLVKFENGVATIDQKYKLKAEDLQSPMGGEMKFEAKDTEGMVELNTKTGFVDGSKMSLNMTMDGGAMKMVIGMTMTMKKAVESKEGDG